MSAQSISSAISILEDIEKKIDEILSISEDFKRKVLEAAEEEARKIREKIVFEVGVELDNLLKNIEMEVRKEAEELLKKADEEAKRIEEKFYERIGQIVDSVLKLVLEGEK